MKLSTILLFMMSFTNAIRPAWSDTSVDPYFLADSLVIPMSMQVALVGSFNPLSVPHDSHFHRGESTRVTHGVNPFEPTDYRWTARLRPYAYISDFNADGRLDLAVFVQDGDSTRLEAVIAGSSRSYVLFGWSNRLPREGLPPKLAWHPDPGEWLTDHLSLKCRDLDLRDGRLVLLARRGREPLAWRWEGKHFERVD